MFDQILDLVKDQLGNNPDVSQNVPGDKKEQVHHEVATQITKGLKEQASNEGVGGLLSKLAGGIQSGGALTNAIEGGVIGALGNKIGLPPAATGAIAAALPGLLQKLAHKANDPNDHSITPDSITKSLGGGLGNLF
ncbi:MAG: hypothetical protein K0S09_1564 [Sphingobacteriaceae bacterium]|jgi:hypothetical protein|nr:hypothetical protein [Sphingobacteriaceae bacterium]